MRYAVLALFACSMCSCGPVMLLGLLSEELHDHKEIEGVSYAADADHFKWYAKGVHGYEGEQSYTWFNSGTRATVDAREGEKGCTHEGSEMTVTVSDAEGTVVYDRAIDNYDDPKFHYTEPTAAGVPGWWTLKLGFNDDSSLHKLSVLVDRSDAPQLTVTNPADDFHWTATKTDDRDTTERYTYENTSPQGSVTVDHTEHTVGTVQVEVFDATGTKVATYSCGPQDPAPHDEPTLVGTPGTWTVTLTSTDLTTKGLDVHLEKR